ncbi:DUF806 family protein [Weissella confusa]|uniref:DUF806 family protein n=1 Tax=Weissella confusa TaxID=1583 RepID=UPI00108226FE|nr:DUF806 family protein [Weissella confusa]TGE52990.1 hypothetical protein C6P18_02650 [Weissella confusa]TGE59913.1 hypothetical protein C6P19_02785 [Weissella confusa]TGE61133.1 hypothetical protein C6P21_02895 [Weissella confusa]
MTPVEEIDNVVHSVFPDWQVYFYAIPEEVINNKNVTQVLITESNSDITIFGGNTFNEIAFGYRLQVFYGLDEENLISKEITLYKALESFSWRITDSQPRYLDISQTDGQQIIKIIEVNKTMTLDELDQ